MHKSILAFSIVALFSLSTCQLESDLVQEEYSEDDIKAMADEFASSESFVGMASNYKSYRLLLLLGVQSGAQPLTAEERTMIKALPSNDREQSLLEKGYLEARAISLALEDMEIARKQTLEEFNAILLELNDSDKEVFIEYVNTIPSADLSISPREALIATSVDPGL